MNEEKKVENNRIEIDLLLEGIHRKYGYDFRNYTNAHIKRRLEYRLKISGCKNYMAMLHKLIYNEVFFNELLLDLSINVSEMFRDPGFYQAARETVIPYLRTYPFIKLWHAGCSAGQEAYSMVIMLKEEGLIDKCQVYATDFNELILAKARDGIYPLDQIKKYTQNYQKAGGKRSFGEYYTADYHSALIRQSLKDRILFTYHNLVSDGVFGEMNIIFCRNVLIYFDQKLQNKVLKLFYDSLVPGGYLCLGTKESLRFSDCSQLFEPVIPDQKIFRKKR
ncbi:MAG: chemotaxis protein CheR [Spirochaetaceae bacterium 4572_59]|nr:MAG: chemotaxis protein CheR [Spirochaetaceae bacterium 4572_59]